jgi:cob(I)alamin adenosyltransferase
MYEIQVHNDGDTEIRKVPSAYKGDGTTVIVATFDEAAAELGTYGIEDDRINVALAAAENDWEWVTV